jgi:hypothetical protein
LVPSKVRITIKPGRVQLTRHARCAQSVHRQAQQYGVEMPIVNAAVRDRRGRTVN